MLAVLRRDFVDNGGGEVVGLWFEAWSCLCPVGDGSKESITLHCVEGHNEILFGSSSNRTIPRWKVNVGLSLAAGCGAVGVCRQESV